MLMMVATISLKLGVSASLPPLSYNTWLSDFFTMQLIFTWFCMLQYAVVQYLMSKEAIADEALQKCAPLV